LYLNAGRVLLKVFVERLASISYGCYLNDQNQIMGMILTLSVDIEHHQVHIVEYFPPTAATAIQRQIPVPRAP
jgi:hypothetical protein